MKKPTTSDPASPIKILAGGKLKVKKPISVPTITMASEPTNTCPLMTAGISSIAAQIAAIPAAAPSMLSRKLNALIIRTIQNAERQSIFCNGGSQQAAELGCCLKNGWGMTQPR